MPDLARTLAAEARPDAGATEAPVVQLDHIGAHARDGAVLLDDVSLAVARGHMLAVVGPTGAGKTSLARVLTGELSPDAGALRIDGRVAFVPQEDALHAGLRLRDALLFAAALRLPKASVGTRAERVRDVLDELGLGAHGATLIGNLSGGQRKRASIAAQLLGDPDVLVLDEPTEGLDPGYAKVVLTTLRALAESGRTIVVVTHSLETLHASDRVLFLAAGGAVAFFGTPKQATAYFGTRDTAEVFLALDTAPHLWREKFRRSRLAKPNWAREMPETDTSRAQFGVQRRRRAQFGVERRRRAQFAGGKRPRGQVAMLVRRFVALLRGDRRHLTLLLAQAPVVGALLWAVLPANALVPEADGEFSSKAGVVILFLVLSTTWLGVSNAVREVVRERAIVKWEAASGLSPRAYIASKFVALGSLITVQASVITFLATARQHSGDRVTLMALAALAGLAATALGLALSAAAASSDRATALLPVTLVVQLVLAGEWAANANVPLLHEARWLVGTRWGMEAMVAALHDATATFNTAVAVLVALTAGGVLSATALVNRATRLAALSPRTPPIHTGPRIALAACATAVALSVSAGGAGVLAVVHRPATAPHAGLAFTPPSRTTTPTLPPPATIAALTPVTAAPPATTPPVPVVPARRVATTPVTVPELDALASVPDIVVPTPETTPPTLLPSAPQVTPTSATPTRTLFGNLFKLFNPFAPKVTK